METKIRDRKTSICKRTKQADIRAGAEGAGSGFMGKQYKYQGAPSLLLQGRVIYVDEATSCFFVPKGGRYQFSQGILWLHYVIFLPVRI